MDPKERRMTAERCATLMSVAMANRLDEVWVSPHPELFYLYLFQYFPSIAKRFVQHLTYLDLVNLQDIFDICMCIAFSHLLSKLK